MEEYNKPALEFYTECNKIAQTNGANIDGEKLSNLAQGLNNAAVMAKNKVSALKCPSKYEALNKATIDYMQANIDMANLYIDFFDGNLTLDEFNERLSAVGTDGMLKEAAYKSAFEAVMAQ